jgi:hypothetical protein
MKRDFLISSHPANDDPALWTFARTSNLPRNYFHRHGPICWVSVGDALAVLAAIAVIVALATGVLA